jgi:hypothetical protein
MSAPPLPEAFGNYALGDFVEVVSPADISWLPQTAGWTWVGIALSLFAGHRVWRALGHWYRNRYRREAASRLRQINIGAAGTELVAEINKLLKLAAMAAYSREAVASLYGTEWIDFLNSQCPQPAFSSEQQDLLTNGVYRQQLLDTSTGRSLLDASLTWIKEHREAVNG